MAQTAQIGALNISLSMSTAQFMAAVNKAEGAIGRLGARFGVMAGVAAAGTTILANSIVGAASGMAGGFGQAVASIGELVDASSKFGIPIEKLAGLKYAADLSGASLEQLGVGAGKLAKNLTEIAGGKTESPAAKALAAIGVSAMTSAGQLKGVDDVIIEVADKFAGMEDGAAKTAMAMQLFGKSGAQLIPMLNSGSAELAKMREEARSMGLVLDSETAKGIEALGDEWDKVKGRMEGFQKQLVGALLPTLKFLVKEIQNWIDSKGGVQAWAQSVANGIKTVVDWSYQASAAFRRITENLKMMGSNFADFFTGQWARIAETNKAGAEQLRKIDEQLAADRAAIWKKFAEEGQGPAEIGKPKDDGLADAPIPDAGAAEAARAAAQKLHNDELDRYFEKLRLQKELAAELDPVTAKLAEQQDRLNRAFQKGALDADSLGIALSKASAVAMNSYGAMAGSIVSDLGKVFGESKGFAIAQALINTFQSVTNAWANVPWPVNIAAAAAALAAGMAQVNAIKSTNKGGGGGGVAAASAPAPAGTGGGAGSAPQLLQVRGISPNEFYSGDMMRGLTERLLQHQKDGGEVLLS